MPQVKHQRKPRSKRTHAFAGAAAPANAAEIYQVQVTSADVAAGASCWRVASIHHLAPDVTDNNGNDHNLPPEALVDKAVYVPGFDAIPDGAQCQPGQAFTQSWRLRNTGTTTWTDAYQLRWVGDQPLGAPSSVPASPCSPGAEVTVRVPFVAPTTPGSYRSVWQLYNAQGQPFGDRIWTLIAVNTLGEDDALAPPAGEQLMLPASADDVQRLVANTWNRYGGFIRRQAAALGIDPGIALAVLVAESAGEPFGADGRMTIRFENQIFYEQWGKANGERFNQCFRFNVDKSWQGHQWRPTPDSDWRACHTSQATEWAVLTFARTLDEKAALCAISMGAPQIMGFNHLRIGYATVQTMFADFQADVRKQLAGLFRFMQVNNLVEAVQRGDFLAFATVYNGGGQPKIYQDIMQRNFAAWQTLQSAGRGLAPAPTRPAPVLRSPQSFQERKPKSMLANTEVVTVGTRPPLVTLTPANLEQLKRYPRPPQDNGRGLHFHLDLRDESIALTVQRLQYINATWTMIYAQDELQAQRAAKACCTAGIMPVVRIGRKVDDFVEAASYVKALQAINVPPYVQIYNEPADGREWAGKRPDNYVNVFADHWARQAAAVFDAGGYPGLQVMGKDELDAAIDAVAANRRNDLWQRAFFVQHDYGVNHPPAYPYDAINQQEHPGATIVDDPVAVLAFQAFAYWMQQRLGFVLPIMGGEGGWQFGVDDDRRYPKVISPYHAQYHCELFDWFRTGVLANGEPLPDYLFSVTPWLVGGWNTAEDWWGGPLGDKTETIEAVHNLPSFVRRFSWNGGVTPVTPNPPTPDPKPQPPQPLQWDPRLDTLGVRLTRSTAPQAWQLTSALYRDDREAENRRHVYVKALNADGSPAAGVRFVVDWVGRHADENPSYLLTDANGEGSGPMFINMHPDQKDGIVFSTAVGQPSDRVDGMGLPNNQHVCYLLTFQYGASQENPPPNPVKPPEPVKPPNPVQPPASAQVQKLGFYLQQSIDQNGLWDAIGQAQPPVILIHADGVNDMLLNQIRAFRAPNALVIGRWHVENDAQRALLESDDPEGAGRNFAEQILNYDFGKLRKRAANGKLWIDAWMSLNEALPGPASSGFQENEAALRRLYDHYDRFQVAFRARLLQEGIEAVAFNFAAGNFTEPAHYLEFFPRTLAAYTYLGFHEYGWPSLQPGPGVTTSAGLYRGILAALRAQYGNQHRVIITETGLTRAYGHPENPDQGWLNAAEPLDEERYWQSLIWYNNQLAQDDYVAGACLYQVGHTGDWATFRHLGQDNQGRPLHLIDRIVALKQAAPRAEQPAVQRPRTVTFHGNVLSSGKPVSGAVVRLLGEAKTLGGVRGAALAKPGVVTWSRRMTGFAGSLRNAWDHFVAGQVAGLTWEEFKRVAVLANPSLVESHQHFMADQSYFLPQNNLEQTPLIWDRTVTGYAGTLRSAWLDWVQGKAPGLTYARFQQEVLQHNPRLAETQGRFHTEAQYQVPRMADARNYVLSTITNQRGHFQFAHLPPGTYQLEVRHPGFLVYKEHFVVDVDTEITASLKPLLLAQQTAQARGIGDGAFVGVIGREFVVNGQILRFIGVNLRGLVYYGAGRTPMLQYTRPEQRVDAVRSAAEMGAKVVRVFLPCVNVSAQETIDYLRATLDVIGAQGMYLIPALVDFYKSTDFRIPGDDHFYAQLDPYFSGELLKGEFYRGGYQERYLAFVQQVVAAFKDDPRLFAWEIGNELKYEPAQADPKRAAFINFMHTVARAIKQIDPNHLVTTGMISTSHASLDEDELWRQLYGTPEFDFLTVHCYNQEYANKRDYEYAATLEKPFIIEEAGFGSACPGDRVTLVREDMARWFGFGASGYLQWGFMPVGGDIGDGDRDSGMDHQWHNGDFDGLFNLYRERAAQLADECNRLPHPPQPVTPPEPLAPPANFLIGQQVYAQTVVNVRRSPGYVNKPAGDILGQLAQSAPATVTGASTSLDHLIWWPIHATLVDGQTVAGWAAEAIPGAPLLGSALPPADAPRGLPQALG